MKKILSGLLAVSAVLIFPGCQPTPEESSGTSFVSLSSVPKSSSHAEPPAPHYSLNEVCFSNNPQNDSPLVVSYPKGMFSPKSIWIDSAHIYLEPDKNSEIGAIVDIENKTITQAPAYNLRWNNISYCNNFIYLSMNDATIQKMDSNFNLVSSISFDLHPEDIFYSAFYAPTESLYYIDQDRSTGKATLCLKKGEQVEPVIELPTLSKNEFYQSPQISPSGDKIFFYRVTHEFLVTQIYFYDVKTNTLTSTTRENGDGKIAGFWMPSGSWMGEQPIFMLFHEHDGGQNSNEIIYGNPPEAKAQAFYKRNDLNVGLFKDELSPWSCATYIAHSTAEPDTFQAKFFYFRDNKTFLSYQPEKNQSTPYVQLSPDYNYLSCILSPEEQDTVGQLLVFPTKNLWKPLDWQQIQVELDGIIYEISSKG